MSLKTRILASLVGIVMTLPMTALAQVSGNNTGRVLLDVQKHGEAWYVVPTSKQKVYLPDGNAAYDTMRVYGLGVLSKDLEKIPVGLVADGDIDSDGDGLGDKIETALGTDPNQADTDGDGFSDKMEVIGGYRANGTGTLSVDKLLVTRLKGRILLQTDRAGQAWYVNPADGKRYYMKDGQAAYVVMRLLGVGAPSMVIESIQTVDRVIDCGNNKDCFIHSTENWQPAEVNWDDELRLLGVRTRSSAHWKFERKTDRSYFFTQGFNHMQYDVPTDMRAQRLAAGETETSIDAQVTSLNAETATIYTMRYECTLESGSQIAPVLKRWQVGDINFGAKLAEDPVVLTGDYELIGKCVQRQK